MGKGLTEEEWQQALFRIDTIYGDLSLLDGWEMRLTTSLPPSMGLLGKTIEVLADIRAAILDLKDICRPKA